MASRVRPWRQAARLRRLLADERETVRRLRELNDERNGLVASASHELRTPLTAILGFARTLAQPGFGDDPELRHELLSRIIRQGDRLLRITEELLDSAHREEGGPALDAETLGRIVGSIGDRAAPAPTPRAG